VTKPSGVVVVIPAFKVRNQIERVISAIGPEVMRIIVIDDACPEATGNFVESTQKDNRIEVIFHKVNQGVGGAVVSGYRRALELNAQVVVKLDGDGQMDPKLIPDLVEPILQARADYVKGNRFYRLENLSGMPRLRILGNAGLSLFSKLSSGYWNIADPTNGFTAVHGDVLKKIPLDKIAKDYFFECDLLFHLRISNAVVHDFTMESNYGDENSSLNIGKAFLEFPFKLFRNHLKRIFISYYLRDFNAGSFELPLALSLGLFGTYFGITRWAEASAIGVSATAGTVMLSALPLILGVQFALAFLSQDIASVPKRVVSK
jgi:dolichol-phosphate mannosyltransferase